MASGPTLPPQAYTREVLTSAFNWLQTQPESVKKLATTPDALVGLFMRAQRFGASSLEADAPISSQNFMSDLKNLAEGLKQFEDPRERKAQAASHASSHLSTHAAAHMAPHSATLSSTFSQTHHSASQTGSHSGNHSAQASQAQANQPPAHASAQATLAQAYFATQNQNINQSQSHTPVQNQAQFHNQPMTQFQASFGTPAIGTPMMSPYSAGQNHAPQQMANAQLPAPLAQSPVPHGLTERSLQMIQEVKMTMNLSNDADAINLMLGLAYKSLKSLLT